MPSNPAINPFNYNIDNFDSGILGPISDTNFRNYLLTHNLPVPNSVISGVLGGNPWQDLGTEYDVSQSNPNVVDVPNLQDVAQIPSLYNNLTNPRQVNLTNNLQNLNPEVQNILGQNTPIQAGLGQDATSLFNPNTANLDLPSPEDAAQNASDINNFTTPRYDNLDRNPTPQELVTWNPIEFAAIYNQYSGDYDTSYGVPQTLRIGYVGNTEEWVNQSGIITTTNEIRQQSDNRYGPNEMVAYTYNTTPGSYELVSTNTGLIQYNTGVQGDFRDQLLSRSLGVGIIPFSTLGSGINYKPDGTNISELDTIARKRRGIELLNRIKLNFVDNTVGALNISPFNLLSGGDIIQKNYDITVPKTGLGKAAQFVADLAGFNLPTSIIPDGSFQGSASIDNFSNNSASSNTHDINDALLDHTGSATKSLLYNALYINKYGPKIESVSSKPPKTKLGEFLKEKLGAGQPPETQNYLTYDGTVSPPDPKNATNLRSTEFEKQSATQTPIYGGFFGDNEYPTYKSFSDNAHFDPADGTSPGILIAKPSTTWGGQGVYATNNVTSEVFDWRSRKNGFKKGLLKYTQQIVNETNLKGPISGTFNEETGEAIGPTSKSAQQIVNTPTGMIGYFDSDVSFKDPDTDNRAHKTGSEIPEATPTLPSKGNQVRNIGLGKENKLPTGGDLYCRSWTSRRKYHKGSNLIRNEGNWWKISEKYNPLMTMNWGSELDGRPKIAWDSYDNTQFNPSRDQKKLEGLMIPYMFSIENLAWKNAPQRIELPKCELGPNGGRIMWFPPYNIDFSDNTSVSWDTTNFIGRGEPIYTYNHTERSGNLSFTIVVDHPEVLNHLRGNMVNSMGQNYSKINSNEGDDQVIESFFAGCNDIKELFGDLLPEVKKEEITQPTQTKSKTTNPPPVPPEIKIYFENTVNAIGPYARPTDIFVSNTQSIGRVISWEYEVTKSCIGGSFANTPLCSGTTGLNAGKEKELQDLAKFLVSDIGKNYSIQINAYTSASNPSDLQSGVGNFNKPLADDRAASLRKYLYNEMVKVEAGNPPKLNGTNLTYPTEEQLKDSPVRWLKPVIKTSGSTGEDSCTGTGKCSNNPGLLCYNNNCVEGDPCLELESGQANSKKSKKDRAASVTLVPNTTLQQQLLNTLDAETNKLANEEYKKSVIEAEKEFRKLAEAAANQYINECDYFMEVKKDAPFVYTSLTEKIKNFHPAFHAITPEGFNSRLTFLQQCTRQGPQLLGDEQPQNMVFGRPPVCVLRIGDFYHTKIIIDSVNFTFDPLLWDLNPEGIGVQPMLVKVDLGFKFVGGSSLGGPIKQLQNAVSFNFFANTSVYNPMKEIEEYMDKKQKFIYGAFLTPDEADNAYRATEKINQQTSQDQSSNTEQPTSDAEMSTEEKDKITEANDENFTGTIRPEVLAALGGKPPTTPDDSPINIRYVRNLDGQATIVVFELKESEKDKWKIFNAEYTHTKTPCGSSESWNQSIGISDDGSAKFFIENEVLSELDAEPTCTGDYLFEMQVIAQPILSDGTADTSRKQNYKNDKIIYKV